MEKHVPTCPEIRAFHRGGWRLLLFLLLATCSSRCVGADEPPKRPPAQRQAAKTADEPYFVLNFSGVNRLLKNVDFVFESVKRPEFAAAARGVLALAGDLKGIDRTRPFGVMAYINPGEVPEPVAVGYVPVASLAELRRTLRNTGPIRLSPKADGNGNYTLKTGSETLQLTIQGGYAFVARQAVSLKRRFPDPARKYAELTRKYDLALRLDFKRVPQGMKTMLLDYLRAVDESKQKKKRAETLEQYGLRRALSEAALELLARILHDGSRLTLGCQLSRANKRAVVDLRLQARPNTELSRLFKHAASRSSSFAVRDKRRIPLAVSASWPLNRSAKRVFLRALDLAQKRLHSQTLQPKPRAKHVDALFQQLRLSVNGGHLDLALQVLAKSPGRYVLFGGMRIAGGKMLPKNVSGALAALQRRFLVTDLKVNPADTDGIAWSQFRITGVNGTVAHLFGNRPAAAVGIDRRTVWFAAGTPKDLSKIRKEFARKNRGNRPASAEGTLLQLAIRMTPWLPVLIPRAGNGFASEIARRALRDDNDEARIALKVSEAGMTLHAEFDVGFVRLIGLTVIGRLGLK